MQIRQEARRSRSQVRDHLKDRNRAVRLRENCEPGCDNNIQRGRRRYALTAGRRQAGLWTERSGAQLDLPITKTMRSIDLSIC
jgi:hypothetical protein